ncbi:endolytic transglycosylase MltG [Pseudogemmobacter faecipullorum]|uniref:Endolytic murein transglycosylase n=1 Tax=Pseudogemmobacter faecipullorum TaxID=2755041 RepID=A0ABS8CKT0_9RHOB|nr:endolytic transglycosylase MltG [Pseudogemmobacter faecipullorum]MCB5410004.1 endolytic transglycosylase MltG [Pseudogemmobacter faecipullorum]
MWKSVASNALTLFIVLLAAAAGLVAWGRSEFNGPGPLTEAVCIQVERGASVASVSRNLEARGAVSDARIFRIGADYAGKARDLKFGSYMIPAGASMDEVLTALTQGGASTCGQEIQLLIGVAAAQAIVREMDPASNRFIEVAKFAPGEAAPAEYTEAMANPDMRYRVTLVEGATSWAVADALRKADFLSGELREVAPEGSLAPQSYDVEKGSDRAALIGRMASVQEQIMAELWPGRAADLPYDTPEQAMIMASIIEKETSVPEERGLVASVFVNRLRQGMRLQTDPTVIYGITKGEGVLGRGLRASELRRSTPYNTYVIDGLPPGPIANPGRASIAAALNPDTADYVFFVADGTGGHAFARTLAEHNENVARWRAIEKEQGASGSTGTQTGQ